MAGEPSARVDAGAPGRATAYFTVMLLTAVLLIAAFSGGKAAPLHALTGGAVAADSAEIPCPHHPQDTKRNSDIAGYPAYSAAAHHAACVGACCGICFSAAFASDCGTVGAPDPIRDTSLDHLVGPPAPEVDDPPPRLQA